MKRMMMIVAALLLAGCSGGETKVPGTQDDRLTKADARQMGGVDEDGEDICDDLDWYGDGVCDDFCVQPDEDCGTNNASNNPTNNTTAPTNNATNNNTTNPTNNATNNTTNNTSGGNCGGIAGLQCADNEFCNYPDDTVCGASDQFGVCEPRPDVCTDHIEPVCGCDGMDYTNPCEANAAGADVASMGTCAGPACTQNSDCARGETCVNGQCTANDPTGTACGARLGDTCPDGYFCDWDRAGICGRADATGTCQPTPQICPDVVQPVCGCDNMTYGNECEANGAGVSVLSDGECQKACSANADCAVDELCINGVCQDIAQGQCGGIAGFQCAADEWCDYPDNTMCGAADQIGDCKPRPDACLAVFDPVCGCDGMTYSNACYANAAGVDVANDGACNK